MRLSASTVLKLADKMNVKVFIDEQGRLRCGGTKQAVNKIKPLLKRNKEEVIALLKQAPVINHTASGAYQASTQDGTICLACKHYQPDWSNPIYRKDGKPTTRGKCKLTGLEVMEFHKCNNFEHYFGKPQQTDVFSVQVHKILTMTDRGLMSWPEHEVKLAERDINKYGGLSAAVEAIITHEGSTAYLITCKALGGKVWMVHEHNKVNGITGRRYVVKATGEIRDA